MRIEVESTRHLRLIEPLGAFSFLALKDFYKNNAWIVLSGNYSFTQEFEEENLKCMNENGNLMWLRFKNIFSREIF